MESSKPIIWFDIDNTLYSLSAGVAQEMGKRIHAYFVQLPLDEETAHTLHMKYLTEYGLAIRGLSKHHQIGASSSSCSIVLTLTKTLTPDLDPLDFDEKCDGSLPLDELLHPTPELTQLFRDIDRSKTRVWALTNAYKTHASRVLRILGLSDQIEGTVYCDYSQDDFSCKPEVEFYEQALLQAGVSSPSQCYFVDDNLTNVRAAKKLGWGSCVFFREASRTRKTNPEMEAQGPDGESKGEIIEGVDHVIGDLSELRSVWKELFV